MKNNKNIENTLKKYSGHLKEPVSVYINWAAYDELSDNIRLNEEIALQQLEEVIRLKNKGIKFDYYLMDAFWFSKKGGYRQWREGSWPEGGQKWLSLCKKHNILPGLWFSTNVRVAGYEYWFLDEIDEWKDSLSHDERAFCLFEGGYLSHFMETLRTYAAQGIKIFKFDFADFTAVTPSGKEKYSPMEAYCLNKEAFIKAIKGFKDEFPDTVFLAYNGYGGYYLDTSAPQVNSIDFDWLQVFDSLYCGDPRLADIPCMNFWRSKDIYSDHMVRYYYDSGIPLPRIDNSAFMIGKTGTCYYRKKQAWKGMLLLSLCRGGWVNTYYGNLELIDDQEADWFAKVQKIFFNFQKEEALKLVGGIPGKGETYGYLANGKDGGILIMVNPSQTNRTETIKDYAPGISEGSIIFTDKGKKPKIDNAKVEIGAEQLIVLGYGKYAAEDYNLGIEPDVHIPEALDDLGLPFVPDTHENATTWHGMFEMAGTYRLVIQLYEQYGNPARLSGGAYPDGTTMEKIIGINVNAGGKEIPVTLDYDKALWSGLSWGVGEFQLKEEDIDEPLTIKCTAKHTEKLTLRSTVYKITGTS